MLTALLLALTLATAGADTCITRSDKIDAPIYPDSLCAKCGKKCELVEVYHRGARTWDTSLYPFWELRCPDHGRHVEWLNETWKAQADSAAKASGDTLQDGAPRVDWSTQYFLRSRDGLVEIGLREDGLLVYRKLTNTNK